MPPAPSEAFARLRAELDRTAFRARNGLKHFAGVGSARVEPTLRDEVWARGKVRLFRYRPSGVESSGQAVLLVMSLVTRPSVFDLLPGDSLVARMLEAGHDVFLLDWGRPDAVESENTLETYCDEYLPRAINEVARVASAQKVTLFGYCLGGLMCLLTAAGHPELPLRGMVVLAVPIDFGECGPLGRMVRNERFDLDTLLDETGNVPASTMLQAFRALEPTGDVTTYLNLWNSLSDPKRLAAHQALVGWSGDHIPFPGAAFRQIVELFVRDDALLHGRLQLGGRLVRTQDIELPVLSVVGERDNLVPTSATDPIDKALTNASLDHLRFPAGHAGLMLGRRAQRDFIPAILSWLADLTTQEPA